MRKGVTLALARLPPDPAGCTPGELKSLLQEAGWEAAALDAALQSLALQQQRQSPQPEGPAAPAAAAEATAPPKPTQHQLLVTLAQAAVPAWEVRRVLACRVLAQGRLRHMSVLRCTHTSVPPAAQSQITEDTVRASYRKLSLLLHPDKHKQGSAAAAAVAAAAAAAASRAASPFPAPGSGEPGAAAAPAVVVSPVPAPEVSQEEASSAFALLVEAREALLNILGSHGRSVAHGPGSAAAEAAGGAAACPAVVVPPAQV